MAKREHVLQFNCEALAITYIEANNIEGIPEFDELLEVWNIALPNGFLYTILQ